MDGRSTPPAVLASKIFDILYLLGASAARQRQADASTEYSDLFVKDIIHRYSHPTTWRWQTNESFRPDDMFIVPSQIEQSVSWNF